MSEEHSYPSIPEQAQNLSKFVFEIIKKSMKGDALMVSDEVAEERLSICKQCEYYDGEQGRCKECGCFLEHKVKWSLDSCPLEKWSSSDKDWTNQKYDEVLECVKNGTDPATPWDGSDIPDFPDPETTPVGFVYVYKGTQWQFTGESWIPYFEDTEFDREIGKINPNRP